MMAGRAAETTLGAMSQPGRFLLPARPVAYRGRPRADTRFWEAASPPARELELIAFRGERRPARRPVDADRRRAVTGPPACGRARLSDVAELAGVHVATASRALRSDTSHKVALDALERVRDAARELGYVPNWTASGLRSRRTRLIGVLAADLASPLLAGWCCGGRWPGRHYGDAPGTEPLSEGGT